MKTLVNFLKSKWLTVSMSIVLLVVIIYYVVLVNLEAQVKSEIEEIKKAGQVYSLSAIKPKPIPFKDNAAPLYEAALCVIDFRVYVSPYQNYYDFFLKNREKFKKEITNNELVFKLVKEASLKPQCRFELPYEKILYSGEPKAKKIMVMISILNFMAFKSFEEMENKQIDQAVDTCVLGIHFTRNLMNGTSYEGRHLSLMSLNVGTANLRRITKPLEVMADKGIKADYSKVIAEIDSYLKESENDYSKCMEVERAMGIDLFEMFLKSVSVIAVNSDKTKLLPQMTLRTSILADELFYLRYLKQVLKAVNQNNTSEIQAVQAMYEKQAKNKNKHKIANAMIPNAEKSYLNYKKARENLVILRNKLQALNTSNPAK